ncbi:MAG: tyrosine-type recombinase/integrase [Rhizobiaceae bacterium]|nr:tyrosine-type recombinase/integrase [Rhizobiaceae bacterium]
MAFALRKYLENDRHERNTEITKQYRLNRVVDLGDDLGHISIKDLRVEDIQHYMDENKHRPTSANRNLGILRAVLEDAVAAGTIKANPAASVKRLDVVALGYHTWSEDDIAAYFDHHEPGTTAALAMALMLFTGTSRREVVGLGWHNLTGDRFKFVRHQNASHKHLTLIDIPLHPDLRAILDNLPSNQKTFLQTNAGKPRSAAGLGNKMREWANAAGLSNCTSHGLRKACARRLAEAGAREQEVAAVLGYSDTTSPHVIVGMGHRPELADEGFAALAEAGHDSPSVTEAA